MSNVTAGRNGTRQGRLADCHPDRPHYGNGLCRACYAKDRRGRGATVLGKGTGRSPLIGGFDAKLQALVEAQMRLLDVLTELLNGKAMSQQTDSVIGAREAPAREGRTRGVVEAPALLADEPEDGAFNASLAADLADEIDELPPPPDETQTWRTRLGLFRRNRMWLPDWGPRPDQSGCRAPPELL